jgi:cytoskeletal protein RodZ
MRKALIAALGALVLQLGLVQAAVADNPSDSSSSSSSTTSSSTSSSTTSSSTSSSTTSTTAGPTGPQIGVFDRRPASGPVRTVITVKSITPCVPPADAPNPEVDVALFNQHDVDHNTVTAFEVFAVGTDGTWSGKLTVPADAEVGQYFLTAACFAGVSQTNEPFLIYEEQRFTVTAAAVAPPAAAVPGAPSFTG